MTKKYALIKEQFLRLRGEIKKPQRSLKEIFQIKFLIMIGYIPISTLGIFILGFFLNNQIATCIQILIAISIMIIVYILSTTPETEMMQPDKIDEEIKAKISRSNNLAETIVRCLHENNIFSLKAVIELQLECERILVNKSRTIFPSLISLTTNLLIVIPASTIIGVIINPEKVQVIEYSFIIFFLGIFAIFVINLIKKYFIAIDGIPDDEYVLICLQEAKYLMHFNEWSTDITNEIR